MYPTVPIDTGAVAAGARGECAIENHVVLATCCTPSHDEW